MANFGGQPDASPGSRVASNVFAMRVLELKWCLPAIVIFSDHAIVSLTLDTIECPVNNVFWK